MTSHATNGSKTDVIVVGAGPCGITIANLLGTYGVEALVIDAEPDVYPYPRAVGIDDESLRTFQSVGVVDRLLEDIVQNTPIRYLTSWGRVIAHVEPSARPFGWPRRNLFLQPLFEAVLRDAAKQHDSIELLTGHRLSSYRQDSHGVQAEIIDSAGIARAVEGKYLVGADGGKSAVREIAGITMTGSTAPQKWLVVDVVEDQLDEPYSAVYCDPQRPVLTIPLPYKHRRFEFKITDNDDEVQLTDHEFVLTKLIAPRYGKTPLPSVLRSAIYYHHSRTAERFQDRRVFLAGDAAHLQPPFFGQGMNSGIRDATNLSWKLALVVQGKAAPELLDTYDLERREHAQTMVNFATRMGRMYSPHSYATERTRDVVFRGLQRIPGAQDYILQMKYKPMPRYKAGVVATYRGANSDEPIGKMFMQPFVETMDHRRIRLDDVLLSSFAIIGAQVDPVSALDEDDLNWWRGLGARFVHVRRQRSGALPGSGNTLAAADPAVKQDDTVSVEDVDGAFRDWRLRRTGDEVIVLRPDHYVAAVCSKDDLARITQELRAVLGASNVAASVTA